MSKFRKNIFYVGIIISIVTIMFLVPPATGKEIQENTSSKISLTKEGEKTFSFSCFSIAFEAGIVLPVSVFTNLDYDKLSQGAKLPVDIGMSGAEGAYPWLKVRGWIDYLSRYDIDTSWNTDGKWFSFTTPLGSYIHPLTISLPIFVGVTLDFDLNINIDTTIIADVSITGNALVSPIQSKNEEWTSNENINPFNVIISSSAQSGDQFTISLSNIKYSLSLGLSISNVKLDFPLLKDFVLFNEPYYIMKIPIGSTEPANPTTLPIATIVLPEEGINPILALGVVGIILIAVLFRERR